MGNDIVRVSLTDLTTRGDSVPAVIAEGGGNAQFAYEEFFADLESPHTIAAYRRDLHRFLEHVHQLGLSLQQVTPRFVRAYLDNLKPVKPTDPPLSAPTKKRVLAAIRKFFDFAVTRHAVPLNPALSVKAPKHKVTEGKTPEITVQQARQLLGRHRHQQRGGAPRPGRPGDADLHRSAGRGRGEAHARGFLRYGRPVGVQLPGKGWKGAHHPMPP